MFAREFALLYGDRMQLYIVANLFKFAHRSAFLALSATAKCLATVQNGAEWLPSRCHAQDMSNKKKLSNSTLAHVKKEMAEPRMAKSARLEVRKLDTTRISEQLTNGPTSD